MYAFILLNYRRYEREYFLEQTVKKGTKSERAKLTKSEADEEAERADGDLADASTERSKRTLNINADGDDEVEEDEEEEQELSYLAQVW